VNDFWEPLDIRILQNGVDILHSEPIVYLLVPVGLANPYHTNGGIFAQYRPNQSEWYGGYWQSNQKPILYVKTNAVLDGSQLSASSRLGASQHVPNSGYVVSAANPSGPWIIRGAWDGMLMNSSNTYTDFSLTQTASGSVDDVGKVSVYDYVTDNWQPRPGGDLLVGVNAHDKTGTSLAMSADGLTLAVGSPNLQGVDHIYFGIAPTHETTPSWAMDFTSADGSTPGSVMSSHGATFSSDGMHQTTTNYALGTPFPFGTPFTISMRVKWDTMVPYNYVIEMKNNDGSNVIRVGPWGGNTFHYGQNTPSWSNNEIQTTTTLTTGNWYDILVTHSGSEVKIYIDGVHEASGPASPIDSTTRRDVHRILYPQNQGGSATVKYINFYSGSIVDSWWCMKEFGILQNGVNIIPTDTGPPAIHAASTYYLNPIHVDGTYNCWHQGQSHSSGVGYHTVWENAGQPLFYVQTTGAQDGSQLTAHILQESHSPTGHIVSSADGINWTIRASWSHTPTGHNQNLTLSETLVLAHGYVRVYDYIAPNWQPRPGGDLVGANAGDNLGARHSVAMSDDGLIVAVGSPGESVAAERSPAYFGLAPTGNTAHSTGDWAVLNFEVLQNGNNIINGATVEFFVTPNENPGNPFATSGGYFQYKGAEFHNYWYNNKKPVVYLKANNAIDSSQIDAEIVFRVDHWPSSGNIVYATDPAGPWNVIGQWGTQPVDTWALLPDAGRKQVIALSPLPSLLPPPGKAILYHWDQGAWNNITTLTGNATDDLYGLSLALSSDGMTLAVGVTNYEIGATELRIGQVRVYNAIDDNNAILPDSIKPVIVLNKLNGQVDVSIDKGVLFSDPGVESVTDEFDYYPLLSINDVEIVIPPNIADVGSHTITYSVTDKRGRVGYAYRTVTVNIIIG
tara:strand:+ start:127 stop:2838 length:2712 start_codon:yes stop_codon:yes gene_type:complete